MKEFWDNYIVSFFDRFIDFGAVGKWLISIAPKIAGGLVILVPLELAERLAASTSLPLGRCEVE